MTEKKDGVITEYEKHGHKKNVYSPINIRNKEVIKMIHDHKPKYWNVPNFIKELILFWKYSQKEEKIKGGEHK